MTASFVVVPQWQGSGSSRAMRLSDGANAIRGDLPSKATRVVEVPVEAGESQDTGIHRFACLTAIRAATLAVLRESPEPVITVGGDCGVEFPAIEHALESFGSDTAVVWFDAHADLNTPESSPSGAFHGMVLRALLGDGAPGLVLREGLSAGSIVLAGVRATDDAESDFITTAGIRRILPADVGGAALVEAVRATGASRTYIHVDLDVLDPAEVSGVGYPEPFGVSVAALVESIKALRAEFPLAGAGITEYAPSSTDAASDDLGTILRVVGALTAPTAAVAGTA
ncbi:arginase family protein [Planctomonas psychrotolerans]|uniref:arginase family protein n=1 Tax=Planctomonas psychrotolerans TaxID=2528712 RepID=UPI00123A5280|nr:arginase family protein [Planctomonas psychrotolerans]